MSKKEKLIERFLSKPADFQWRELQSLLRNLDFVEVQGNGSRVKFFRKACKTINVDVVVTVHKPHPDSTVKKYALEQVINKLRMNKVI